MDRPRRFRKPTPKAQAYRSSLPKNFDKNTAVKQMRGKRKQPQNKSESKTVMMSRASSTPVTRRKRAKCRQTQAEIPATSYQAMVTFSSKDWSAVSWQCVLCSETVPCVQDCIEHLMQHAGDTSKVILPSLPVTTEKAKKVSQARATSIGRESIDSTMSVASEDRVQDGLETDFNVSSMQLLNNIEDTQETAKACSDSFTVAAAEVVEKIDTETAASGTQPDAQGQKYIAREAEEDNEIDLFVDTSSQKKRQRKQTGRQKKSSKRLKPMNGSTTYTCEICLWTNKRHYNYHRHLVAHQRDSEPPTCKYCKEKITAVEGSGNFGLRSFKCDLCNSSPMFRRAYERHMTEKHHGIVRDNPKVNKMWAPKAPEKKKSYMCDECGFVSARLDSFEKHRKTHTEHKEFYTCPLCNFISTEMASMRRHQRAHKDQKVCQQCYMVFSSLAELQTHLTEAHGHQDFQYFCSKCGHLAVNDDEFEAHCRQHQCQEAVLYLCEMCSFSSMEKDRLMLHQSGHKITEREGGKVEDQDADTPEVEGSLSEKVVPELKCADCDLTFTQWQKYENHLQLHTTGTFVCQFCQHHAASILALNGHLQSAHQVASLQWQCLLCGVVEQCGAGLARHRKEHHTIKETFVCAFCGFLAARRWNLQRHKERHLMGTLKCQYCDYSAGEKGHLYNHYVKVHHLEPPEDLVKWKAEKKESIKLTARLVAPKPRQARQAPCEICGKNIAVAVMESHMNRHRNIRPFRCHHENCHFSAITSNALSLHIKRSHLGIPLKSRKSAFRCTLCSYKTASKQRLVMHLNKKHRDASDQVFLTSETADGKMFAAQDVASVTNLPSSENQSTPMQESEQEVVVKTEDFGDVSLASVLHQLPLQVMAEALQDQDAPQVMHLVLPENFEGTLHLQ